MYHSVRVGLQMLESPKELKSDKHSSLLLPQWRRKKVFITLTLEQAEDKVWRKRWRNGKEKERKDEQEWKEEEQVAQSYIPFYVCNLLLFVISLSGKLFKPSLMLGEHIFNLRLFVSPLLISSWNPSQISLTCVDVNVSTKSVEA
jgi:hypothetical protein